MARTVVVLGCTSMLVRRQTQRNTHSNLRAPWCKDKRKKMINWMQKKKSEQDRHPWSRTCWVRDSAPFPPICTALLHSPPCFTRQKLMAVPNENITFTAILVCPYWIQLCNAKIIKTCICKKTLDLPSKDRDKLFWRFRLLLSIIFILNSFNKIKIKKNTSLKKESEKNWETQETTHQSSMRGLGAHFSLQRN